ncbi:MAG: 3-dehydroquinate dehydratase [Crocinitomicaceae bacterium]|nr:3-dehydroquinate dehydratase [Crocinitomicaceae bacterium]
MKLLIINGPNLNLLGQRDTQIYGTQSFESYFLELKSKFPTIELLSFQSNSEGEIIDTMQQAAVDGIVLNAGGYTHTSVAIRDCIDVLKTPVVEVHISNIAGRESFRHESLLTPVCVGCVMGFGLKSYEIAVQSFL